jgi:hypothetical protein
VIWARKFSGEKGNFTLKKGNFIEDLWKHCSGIPNKIECLYILIILDESEYCSDICLGYCAVDSINKVTQDLIHMIYRHLDFLKVLSSFFPRFVCFAAHAPLAIRDRLSVTRFGNFN